MRLKQLRDPKPNKVSFRTIYYSTKQPDQAQQAQIGESMLENSLITLLEHDSEVIEYLNQAVPKNQKGEFTLLTYSRQDGVIEEWTPDFSVIWKTGRPMVIEVKPLSKILEKRGFLTDKWLQTKKLAEENNWDFLVFTDSFKATSFRVTNLMDLESQRSFATKECQKVITEIMRKNGSWYKNLFEIMGDKINSMTYNTQKLQKHLSVLGFPPNEVLASVFNLVYHNHLFIDLEKEFLIDTPLRMDKSLYIPLRTWLMKKSDWEDNFGEVNLKFIDEALLTEPHSSRFKKHQGIIRDFMEGMKVSRIQEKHNVSKATVYRILNRSKFGTDTKGLLRKSGSGRPKVKLFEIDTEGKVNFLDAHFQETISYFETPEEPAKEECWRKYLAIKRNFAFRNGLINSWRTSIKGLSEILDDLLSKEQFLSELNRYITEFSKRVCQKRRGFRESTKKFRNITGTTPGTNYIGQICEMDHTPSDIIGIIPLSIYYEIKRKNKGQRIKNQFMKRAVITTLMDLHTRVIIGYAFRYKSPSVETNFIVLRRALLGNTNPFASGEEKAKNSTAGKILRVFEDMMNQDFISQETYMSIKREFDPEDDTVNLRMVADWWDNIKVMPRILHTDNGSDFQSHDFLDWGKTYGVKFHFRPVGGSNYGGHIERLLKTINTHAFHSIPGTTKGTIPQRGDYKSEKKHDLQK